MSIKTIRKLLTTCIIVALSFFAIPLLFQSSETVQILCRAVGIGVLIIFLMISSGMRCPHCDRCIFTKAGWMDMQYCPYCGKDLEIY